MNREERPEVEYSCWSPTYGMFNSIHQWGHLVFADEHGKAGDYQAAISAKHTEVALQYRAHANELEKELKAANSTIADQQDELKWLQFMYADHALETGRTWVEIKGQIYGAKPDERGPIGGGLGYTKVVTTGTYHVQTLDGLLEALKKAKPGEVVFIDGETEIDCTERVRVEKLVIEVPEGVTLAGNRGYQASKGPLLSCDEFDCTPLIRVIGPHARITGLRIRGADPKYRDEFLQWAFAPGRGSAYYYKFPTADGISTEFDNLEVDNCEISGWSHAGIFLIKGANHYIHHNFIHHNLRNGLGYGICHGYNKVNSLIEDNLFNFNKHSIAATGVPGNSYEARDNVEIGFAPMQHNFDVHGGIDREDGTTIAGTSIKIHNNTFRGRTLPVNIRGVPQETAEIHNNWFYRQPTETVVKTGGNTLVYNNAYDLKTPVIFDAIPKKEK